MRTKRTRFQGSGWASAGGRLGVLGRPLAFPIWIVVFGFLSFSGCLPGKSPPLVPVVETPARTDQISVWVKPVDTAGLGSEDRKRWGMDLSAHYTAFEVKVGNHTQEEFTFDPEKVTLTDRIGRSQAPLNEQESISYYTTGGRKSFFTLWPKSSGRVEEETRKIVLNRMVLAALPPGEGVEGALYFRKISPRSCTEMVLTFPFTMPKTGEKKEVTFRFSCQP
jgi:hypothetical protein